MELIRIYSAVHEDLRLHPGKSHVSYCEKDVLMLMNRSLEPSTTRVLTCPPPTLEESSTPTVPTCSETPSEDSSTRLVSPAATTPPTSRSTVGTCSSDLASSASRLASTLSPPPTTARSKYGSLCAKEEKLTICILQHLRLDRLVRTTLSRPALLADPCPPTALTTLLLPSTRPPESTSRVTETSRTRLEVSPFSFRDSLTMLT